MRHGHGARRGAAARADVDGAARRCYERGHDDTGAQSN